MNSTFIEQQLCWEIYYKLMHADKLKFKANGRSKIEMVHMILVIK